MLSGASCCSANCLKCMMFQVTTGVANMHIRFPDTDEAAHRRSGSNAQASTSQPAPAFSASQPAARHQLGADKKQGKGYCMGLALSSDGQLLAAAQSSGRIEVLAAGDASLVPVTALEGHTDAVTGLMFDPGAPDVLLSCGLDGSLMTWDARTGRATGG